MYSGCREHVAALRTRGLNFTGTLGAVARRYGRATAERVAARVEGEAGELLRQRAFATTRWYSVEWYDQLLEAIERELPNEPDVCREISRAGATEDLNTIFKAISFVASPDFALVNATRVASMYFDGGRISVLDARPGRIHFRFEAFHGFTRRLWADFVGGMEAVIDLLNLERLPTEVVLDADTTRCEVVIRYAR